MRNSRRSPSRRRHPTRRSHDPAAARSSAADPRLPGSVRHIKRSCGLHTETDGVRGRAAAAPAAAAATTAKPTAATAAITVAAATTNSRAFIVATTHCSAENNKPTATAWLAEDAASRAAAARAQPAATTITLPTTTTTIVSTAAVLAAAAANPTSTSKRRSSLKCSTGASPARRRARQQQQQAESLQAGGVLLHTFDGLEDSRRPWRPCPRTGEGSWCAHLSDRMAATFVNADARHVWKPTVGGLVLSPCAFATDGNSMHKSRSCIGLGGSGANAHRRSRSVPAGMRPAVRVVRDSMAEDPASANTVCHFGGKFGFHALNLQKGAQGVAAGGSAEAEEDDEEAQAALHNEMVVNGDSLIAQLPKAIEAVYFVGDVQRARRQGGSSGLVEGVWDFRRRSWCAAIAVARSRWSGCVALLGAIKCVVRVSHLYFF